MSLQKRAPTAIVLLALVFAAVQWAPAVVFFLAIQAVAVLALIEFYNLARRRGLKPQRAAGVAAALILAVPFHVRTVPTALALFAALAFLGIYYLLYARTLERIAAVPASIGVTAFGALYIGFTLDHIVLLRADHGPFLLYFFFAAIFLGDTGAYLFGTLLGRHKMSPLVSPHKTWEGCAGGLVFAGLGAAAAQQVLLPAVPLGMAILTGVVAHAVAQASDPLESLFKRAAGVKDSSHLLPGHGGFLDRVDSLLLAAPVFYYWVLYLWKSRP